MACLALSAGDQENGGPCRDTAKMVQPGPGDPGDPEGRRQKALSFRP